jgi:hydrogenase maturation protease
MLVTRGTDSYLGNLDHQVFVALSAALNTDAVFAPNGMLLIGIGNEYARDDGAGLLVAREVKETARDNFGILEHNGEGTSLLEAWKGATWVIVIDAVRSGAEPGKVYRFDAGRAPLPAQPFRGSTHAFGLYEAVELARSLNQLPRWLTVYGIEGQDFTAGVDISPAVRQAIGEVAQAVLQEVETLRRENDSQAR